MVNDESGECLPITTVTSSPVPTMLFGGIEVFNSDPVQVNLALTYDRYGASGNKLLRCQGVYCVTNNDGRWGIQLMSTIFTPGPQVGMQFPDSAMIAHRLRETPHQRISESVFAGRMGKHPPIWAEHRRERRKG